METNTETIEETVEIIRQRIAEAIAIGACGTDGDFTDLGLTYYLMQDLGLIP